METNSINSFASKNVFFFRSIDHTESKYIKKKEEIVVVSYSFVLEMEVKIDIDANNAMIAITMSRCCRK